MNISNFNFIYKHSYKSKIVSRNLYKLIKLPLARTRNYLPQDCTRSLKLWDQIGRSHQDSRARILIHSASQIIQLLNSGMNHQHSQIRTKISAFSSSWEASSNWVCKDIHLETSTYLQRKFNHEDPHQGLEYIFAWSLLSIVFSL